MKTILFLTNQLPYPPVSGGTIKTWGVLKHLAKKHQVVLGSFLKGKDPAYVEQMKSHISLAESFLESIHVPRTVPNLLRSYALRMPLNLFENRSESFKQWVDRTAPQCDILFIDHYEMYQYVPSSYSGRVILHQHNAEHVIWRRLGELDAFPRKWVVKFEAKRIANLERGMCMEADRVLAAPNDQQELMQLGVPPEKFALTYHLGDDHLITLPDLRYADSKPIVLFVGTLSWEANRDGLKWFIREVWPKLIQVHPDLRFRVIGRGVDDETHSLARLSSNIELAGFVENLDPEYEQARVFVCPLRFGSGTKVKVINALSRGLPVAATSIGAEGLPNAEDIMMVADEPQALTDSILTLVDDPGIWKRCALRGREAARTELSWERVLGEMDAVLDEG